MKVFISWSKERSNAVALLIQEFLNCVLQEVDPWVSSGGVESGEVWFSKITKSLAETKVGILCLTPENKENPWIMFEAGALMKGLEESRVHILLMDLKKEDVGLPLSQFNLTVADHEGLYELFRSINAKLIRPLTHPIFENVFATYWEKFKPRIEVILNDRQQIDVPTVVRNSDDLLSEILGTVRGLDKRIRYIESVNKPIRNSTGITKQEMNNIREAARANGIKPTHNKGVAFLSSQYEVPIKYIVQILTDMWNEIAMEDVTEKE
jgi:hypothetical protein